MSDIGRLCICSVSGCASIASPKVGLCVPCLELAKAEMKHAELFDLFVDRLIKQKTFVYFVYCETSGAVKIGKSRDVGKRFSSIQTSHPNELELLFYMPTGDESEKKLHEIFCNEHIRGEWFRTTGLIADTMRAIAAGKKSAQLNDVSKSLKQEIHQFWLNEAMA